MGRARSEGERRTSAAAMAGLLLVLLAAGIGADSIRPISPRSLYSEAQAWTTDAGEAIDLSSLQGRRYVLTMFYSDCTTKCPRTLARLRELDAALTKAGRPIELVLASFDWRQDSPQRLARFRRREELPASWRLLSGTEISVDRLAARLGLSGYKDLGEHVVHSVRIAIVDEKGVMLELVDGTPDDVPRLVESAVRPAT